jgi:hypothetical protein
MGCGYGVCRLLVLVLVLVLGGWVGGWVGGVGGGNRSINYLFLIHNPPPPAPLPIFLLGSGSQNISGGDRVGVNQFTPQNVQNNVQCLFVDVVKN